MKNETVIIVGAGIAGLVIASELAPHYHVVVLEARGWAGGRIYTHHDSSFPITVEGGAEFLHGSTKYTRELMSEAGIKPVEVAGKIYRKENAEWVEQKEMIPGWKILLHIMNEEMDDITLKTFLDKYYDGPEHAGLRKLITDYAEGFDNVDIARASIKALHQEWENEGKQYRVKGGYGQLIEHMLNKCRKLGCEIRFNTIAKQINWRKNKTTVITGSGGLIQGSKCIITLPLGILQNSDSKMSLAIKPEPPFYRHAINQIGFGGVVKVALLFSQRLWPADMGFVLCDEIFPTIWTQLPAHNHLLTCWAGGSRALRLSHNTDGELINMAIASIARALDVPASKVSHSLQAAKVFNWQKVPTAQGSYSYATPASEQARRQLLTPVEDTLYFSGEGMYYGPYPGTVEAAIVSAKYTVQRILRPEAQ